MINLCSEYMQNFGNTLYFIFCLIVLNKKSKVGIIIIKIFHEM